jgi:hypothetical protein
MQSKTNEDMQGTYGRETKRIGSEHRVVTEEKLEQVEQSQERLDAESCPIESVLTHRSASVAGSTAMRGIPQTHCIYLVESS